MAGLSGGGKLGPGMGFAVRVLEASGDQRRIVYLWVGEIMGVPLLDIKKMHAPIRDALAQKVLEVMDSAMYVNGKYVDDFEAELAAYCGAAKAVGVSSGSDALIIALMALGVKPGDEIITTPFTFFATVGAIVRVGATPVFVDIEPRGFNIDPSLIEERMTSRTVGIIPVSLFGQTADMDAVESVAGKHGVWVLEDAAQSIGARLHGKMSGTFGHAGIFSFFPAKNLGAMGDGGAVLTDDPALADKMVLLRNHGGHHRYYYDEVGGNFRLDAMQAAVLSVKLPHLETWEKVRRDNAKVYDEQILNRDGCVLPDEMESRYHVYNQYVIRVLNGRRDGVKAFLDAENVGNAIYYPLCLHQQKCFSNLGYQTGDFPVSERAAAEVLALPIYTDQAPQVAESLNRALKG